ncbi:AraC family transcriptional regulator [Biostraticola tofi]|uniref:AraC family transcriptional regulator n=2 Tax=Biostraticola tofi TaxID=466109 RepID=A0A4R3YVP5_9GAMM|nr:AraC family transcriptional regulator [Biostraticola tofi]
MSKESIISPGTPLVNTFRQDITKQKCWLLKANDNICEMAFHCPEGITRLQLDADWNGLLLMNRVSMEVISGEATYQELPFFTLVKLQVFIDESRGLAIKYARQQHWTTIQLKQLPEIHTGNDIERWLLMQHHNPSDEMSRLASFLRRTECYWLIRFLLNESVNNDKLNVLGARYGLSYSHFRRLCRNALGNSAKSELRGWRIARALLDVVEERKSLTAIAMRHGYASSSHLSNDIRDAFGVSPRSLWNMMTKKSIK